MEKLLKRKYTDIDEMQNDLVDVLRENPLAEVTVTDKNGKDTIDEIYCDGMDENGRLIIKTRTK